jgi:hypothetical protein
VFIRNWSPSLDEGKLKELFIKYGTITGVKVEKETAEVRYTTADAAQRAVASADRSCVGGRYLKVTYYPPKEELKKKITIPKDDDLLQDDKELDEICKKV